MVKVKTLLSIAILGALITFVSISSVSAGPNCTCRYAGQNYKTGDIMCIRGKLSRCDFVLNNTSWKTIAETCPQVMAPDVIQSPIADNETIAVIARINNRFPIK